MQFARMFEIANLKSLAMKHPGGIRPCLPTTFDQIPKFLIQDQHSPLMGFRTLRSQPDSAGLLVIVWPLQL